MTAVLVLVTVLLGGLAGRAVHAVSRGPLTRALQPVGSGEHAVPARHPPAAATGAARPTLAAAVGAAASTAVVLRFGASPDLPAWVWLAVLGLLLGIVDVREHRLPNRVLLPGIVVAALLLAVAALVSGRWVDLGRGLLAGLVCFGLLLAMALISPAGLGMGDVKLVALTGLYLGWLGWPVVLSGLFLGFLAQGLLGLCLLVTRRAGRRSDLPFGPALLAGALSAALLDGTWAVSSW